MLEFILGLSISFGITTSLVIRSYHKQQINVMETIMLYRQELDSFYDQQNEMYTSYNQFFEFLRDGKHVVVTYKDKDSDPESSGSPTSQEDPGDPSHQ